MPRLYRFACPKCSAKLKTPEAPESTVACPHCGHQFNPIALEDPDASEVGILRDDEPLFRLSGTQPSAPAPRDEVNLDFTNPSEEFVLAANNPISSIFSLQTPEKTPPKEKPSGANIPTMGELGATVPPKRRSSANLPVSDVPTNTAESHSTATMSTATGDRQADRKSREIGVVESTLEVAKELMSNDRSLKIISGVAAAIIVLLICWILFGTGKPPTMEEIAGTYRSDSYPNKYILQISNDGTCILYRFEGQNGLPLPCKMTIDGRSLKVEAPPSGTNAAAKQILGIRTEFGNLTYYSRRVITSSRLGRLSRVETSSTSSEK